MAQPQHKQGQKARKPHKRSQQLIFDSTRKLLVENGYSNLTLAAIAEDSGVSRSTLYRWFPNRTAVVLAFLRHQAEDRLVRPDTGCLDSDLRELHISYLRVLAEPPILLGLKGLCTEIPEESGFLNAFRESYFRPRLEIMREVLDRAQGRGELLPDFDPEILFRATLGMVWYSFFFEPDKVKVHELVEHLGRLSDSVLAPYLKERRVSRSSSLMT